jgi:bacterioferritin
MPQIDIVSEMKKIRADARKKIEDGAITETYTADRQQILELLNSSLATELVCVLRYKRHFYMAKGINYEPVAAEFLEHANEEQEHADRIATRIVQLGGEPDFSPATLIERSHTDYVEGSSLHEMIKEDLVAERIAIDIYREIIRYIGDKDSTTRRLIEDILEDEEEHADDLANLITRMPSDGKSNGNKK